MIGSLQRIRSLHNLEVHCLTLKAFSRLAPSSPDTMSSFFLWFVLFLCHSGVFHPAESIPKDYFEVKGTEVA